MSTITLYDTRTLLAAIELMPPLPTFLWDTFVKTPVRFATTELVEVDYRKGNVRLAPFVASNVGGVVVERQGFDTKTIKFPTIAIERLTKPDELNTRSFGENVYSGRTAADRETQLLSEDITELRKMINLRKNWMVSQLLFVTPGKLSLDVMTDKGMAKGALSVEYKFSNEVSVSIPWTEADADPMSDIEAITSAARDTGGRNPDIILMGTNAASLYRKHPSVRETLDIRNMQFGSLQASFAGDYLKFLGYSPNGLEMYSYSAQYLGDDGTVQPMIPSNRVAALSKACIDAIYAPITQLEPGDIKRTTYIDVEMVPLFLPDFKNNTTGLRLTSRPMIVPENVDGWAIADVV